MRFWGLLIVNLKLLKKEKLKTEEFYNSFIAGTIQDNPEFISDKTIIIDDTPDFPIYMGDRFDPKRDEDFSEAILTLYSYYIDTERDTHLNELFWYSLFVLEKRDYLLNKYPKIKDSISDFHNIVLKKFDWESYIYKCVLAAEYIKSNDVDDDKIEYYIDLIINNLDLYNYLLKSKLFRTSNFVLRFLEIIDKEGISEIMKEKIKGRPELGRDSRYGRMVLFELKNMYPTLMIPLLDDSELAELILENLDKYQTN